VPNIRVADARDLGLLAADGFDLILSSPPYAGTYDYAEHHDVRFLWLGLSREKLDRVQVGARDEGLGSAAERWRQDRRRWLSEMARVARRGAAILLQVGDGWWPARPKTPQPRSSTRPGTWALPQWRESRRRGPARLSFTPDLRRPSPSEHIVMLRKS